MHDVAAPTVLGAPEPPPDAVDRPRLVEALRAGAAGPLTVLSAPAGCGKSVLVASWAARRPAGDVAFLPMPSEDADDTAPQFAASVRDLVRVAGREGRRTPQVLVLDCGDTPLPPALGRELHRLLEECAGLLHLVLVTRDDPPLPLHRYRLAGTLTEIRAADLRFTASEVSALLQRTAPDLAAAEIVAALQTRTGGWAAGLRFAAMALGGRSDPLAAMAEFRGDTGNVAAYLMTEVLAKQPPEIRDFLLRTSVVDTLEPAMAEALTSQRCDARTLQFLAQGNAFVEPVPASAGSYRYQPLFREFLRSQLAFEHPRHLPLLHRRAAEVLAGQGRLRPAIGHAVAGGDWETAARLLVRGRHLGDLLVGRRPTRLRTLLAPLPLDTPGPEAAVTRAALALARLDLGAARAELDRADRLLDEPAGSREPDCRTVVILLEAVLASLGTDLDAGLDAVLAASRALRPGSTDGTDRLELATILAGCEARVLVQRGDHDAARHALTAGVAVAEAARLDAAAADLRGTAALLEAMTGHLHRATVMAHRSGGSRAASLALAWVRVDEQRLEEADEVLRGAAPATPYDEAVLGPVLALLRGRILWSQGDFDLARAQMKAARVHATTATGTSWLECSLICGEARSLIGLGRPEDAVRMLRGPDGCGRVEGSLMLRRALLAAGRPVPELAPASRAALKRAPLDTRVQHHLVLAAAEDPGSEAARRELERALQLAAPQHLRRPFFDAPEGVRALLSGLARRGERSWLQVPAPRTSPEVLAPVPAPAPQVPGPRTDAAVNPLTPKEQEVLGYLADLLTTEEIAETMFVSVNTVRSHVRSILRKLGVARRNEAVRRAWELQLLAPRGVA